MAALKMFEIYVRNPVTKETAKFLGQGTNLKDAVKDGLDGIGKPFRPKQDGKERELTSLGVKLPTGEWVNRSVKNFEAEAPFQPGESTQ